MVEIHLPLASLHVASDGQGWPQIRGLLIAFGLCALIGLERQARGKDAGLRTQALVGMTAALFLMVGKYGFTDVLTANLVRVDPSRVAAGVVTGIGFLGAGLILTGRGRVRGLTTAASIWESAAVGMASGAGLYTLASVVVGLHLVAIALFTPVTRVLPGSKARRIRLEVVYTRGHGVLRELLATCSAHHWVVSAVERRSAPDPTWLDDDAEDADAGGEEGDDEGGGGAPGRAVRVSLTLTGPEAGTSPSVIGHVDGVLAARAELSGDED